MSWQFYGRSDELSALRDILQRQRWFFVRLTGRRRIGKTTLVQEAIRALPTRQVFYVQIPDSAPAGVLSAVHDAMETFAIPESFTRPDSLLSFARIVGQLASAGYLVAIDEFQYFSRKHLSEFTSHLQATVDELTARAETVAGGLIVLGSLHAELMALLEDRDAPLYNRATDQIELSHLDVGSILAILDAHADRAPGRLLFLWTLFEGVPKFYRDAYEQGVLGADRKTLLGQMYFRSSSPLRTEASNWFLSELRGRYDVVLKYVARHPGCSNADIEVHVREVSPTTAEQAGGYLRILSERYRMLERRLPVFARPEARRGRYYLRDNFLRAWLAALHSPVSAINFRPEAGLIDQADQRLADVEGHALERLVAQLYEERSRRGVGDFTLTHRVEGYWDRKGTEIDLVAIDEDRHVMRFGTVKRSPDKLPGSVAALRGHAARFVAAHPRFAEWRHESVAIAPHIDARLRASLAASGTLVQDLNDLIAGL